MSAGLFVTLRGLSQIINFFRQFNNSVIMTLRGGGSEGMILEDDVDVEDWVTCELVQGGYIPSAFHPTTRILS